MPDSCRANGKNTITAKGGHVRGDPLKWLKQRLFLFFSVKFGSWFEFLTLQDKYNINTLSFNLHSLRNKTEKANQIYKAHTKQFYIFRQCTYVVQVLTLSTVNVHSWNVFLMYSSKAWHKCWYCVLISCPIPMDGKKWALSKAYKLAILTLNFG